MTKRKALPRGLYMADDSIVFDFAKLEPATLEALIADKGVPPEWHADAQAELELRGEEGDDKVSASRNPLLKNAEKRAARAKKESDESAARRAGV